MKSEKTLTLDGDSQLAQSIDWDAVDTAVAEPEEKKEVKAEEKKEIKADTKKAEDETVEQKKEEAKVDEVKEGEENADDGKGSEDKKEAKEEGQQPEVKPEQKAEEKSTEQLRKEIEEEIKATIKPKFANETVQRLNELAEAGVDIDSDDFWAWQSRDLDKLEPSQKESAKELVRLELKLENPELPESKIERLLKRKYPALYDDNVDVEDKEYIEAMEDLEIDAIRSKTKLKKHKDTITLPKIDIKAKEQEKEAIRKANEKFAMEARKTVNNYKDQPYKLTDDLEIKFQISNEAREFAERSIINNPTFFNDNYTEKDASGNVVIDYPRLVRDMTRLAQFDDFIKVAFEQGVSVGEDKTFDRIENAGESSAERKNEAFKPYEEQIAEQLPNVFSTKK